MRRPAPARPRDVDVRARAAGLGQRNVDVRSGGPLLMTTSFLDLIDLAGERLGATVIAANDEFFAAKENLIKAGAGGVARGRAHRARQVDGRLGNPPPPRRR